MWVCSLLSVALFFVPMTSPTGRVSVDARDTEVVDVLQQLSAQAGFDVVIGPGVKGKVTLFLSDVEVGEALEALATAGGWAVYSDRGIYRFVTRDEYERVTGQKFSSDMRTEVFSAVGPGTTQLVAALSSLSSPGGRVVLDPDGNNILVYDRPFVIEQMRRLVQATVPHETMVVDLRWIGAEEAARRVRDFLGPNGTLQSQPRRGRLVIRDIATRLSVIRAMLDSLDVPPEVAPSLVRLEHAEADSLVGLLARLQAMQPGRVITHSGNHLLVEDSPRGLEEVGALLSAIDAPRPTVRIDAKILQVSLSHQVETGIDWQAIADRLDGLSLRGSFPFSSDGPRLEGTFGDLADDDYEVLFGMLESFGTVELIARPTLVTHSGREAELMVGSRVPYVTVDTREDNSGVVNRFQRVTYLPVGLSIWVRPKVHADSTVTMALRPELSSIVDYVEAGDTKYPVVETTNACLSVTVPFKRSVVIGGLIRETTTRSTRGVPLLGRIPLVGALFRHEVRERRRGELVIVLRPSLARPDTEDATGVPDGRDP